MPKKMPERFAGARRRRAGIARWTSFSRHKTTSILKKSLLTGAPPFRLFRPRLGGLGLSFFRIAIADACQYFLKLFSGGLALAVRFPTRF
jgi:hypothetical protein